MTWREDLRRVRLSNGRTLVGASFRGVPFLVETSERSGGRRITVHEFPLRDDPFVEDLGRRARTFRVDGYVIGDDYLTQKNALLDALESTEGPGELVVPYYGGRAIRAFCSSLSVRETRTDGGMAVFSIEFAESPTQPPAPIEDVDPVGRVSSAVAAAVTATDDEFVEQYSATGLPSFALASAASALTAASQAIGAALSPVVSAAGQVQELATLTGAVDTIVDQAAAIVRAPADLLGLVRSLITVLVDTIADAPGDMRAALVDAYSANLGPTVAATTSTRARELANQAAISAGLRRAIAVEAANLTPLSTYESIEAATAARDAVAELLEEQAALAGDTAYPALVNLRSEVLRAVPGNTVYARILTIDQRSMVPSLLLAHRLYGSVVLEADVIARNNISHPGFVVGTLRVLSDA